MKRLMNSNFVFPNTLGNRTISTYSVVIRESHSSPGAGERETGMFAELSSSTTSRLIQNERRLNPLWNIWRGTDAHDVEALLWSPASGKKTCSPEDPLLNVGGLPRIVHLIRIHRRTIQLFLTFFLKCNTSLCCNLPLGKSPKKSSKILTKRLLFGALSELSPSSWATSCSSLQTRWNHPKQHSSKPRTKLNRNNLTTVSVRPFFPR